MQKGRGARLPLDGVELPGFEPVEYADAESGARCICGLRRRFAPDGGEICLAVMANGTNIESTLAALPLQAAAMTE